MAEILRTIFYLLCIILLIFAVAQFCFGVDLTGKIYDIKEKLTDKTIKTNLSCSELRQQEMERYGILVIFHSTLKELCENECHESFGLDYNKYYGDIEVNECLEGENLTCLCHQPEKQ